MTALAPTPVRFVRNSALSVAAALAAFGWAAPAGAQPPSATSQSAGGSPQSEATLQVKAQELAGQIEADGRALDELDASYNAAQIRYQNLQDQLASLKVAMQTTGALVAAARGQLKAEAVLAYLTGGAPILTYRPDRPGEDPSLVTSYAGIVAGGQRRAVQVYRATLATQDAQSQQLSGVSHQAAITLSDIHADQASANATLAAQRQALAQVKGQLAAVVAQVEQSRQQAEQSAVMAALTSQGQALPPGGTRGPGPAGPAPTSPAPTAPRAAPTPVAVAVTARPAAPPPPTPRPTAPVTEPPAPPPPATPTTQPVAAPPGPNVAARGADVAVAYARAQLGKPYQWGGAGPNSFDCSGLVMMAWAQAGVYFPHLAQDQYDMTARIPLSDLLPGDLVFFGTPSNVYHVGLYVGGGQMIDAPETGENVSLQSIYWAGLLGAGRVRS